VNAWFVALGLEHPANGGGDWLDHLRLRAVERFSFTYCLNSLI
jgi:hypothetical protein